MNKYKLLLFDLDGTLANTDEMVVQSFYALYKEFKPRVVRTREELYYFSGPPIRETVKTEFPDYDPKAVHQAFSRISKDFYAPYVTEYEDEIEVLKALKEAGYLLGVVTNKGGPLTKYTLEICHIEDMFDVVISADDVDSPKPNPEGIYKAMEKVDIKNKGDVLYIGDNDIDYFSGSNAGVETMLVSWGPREIKCLDKAKYVASSYNEMRKILL